MEKRKRPDMRTFTCAEELYERFMKHCEENALNRSALLRKLIKQYLIEQEGK